MHLWALGLPALENFPSVERGPGCIRIWFGYLFGRRYWFRFTGVDPAMKLPTSAALLVTWQFGNRNLASSSVSVSEEFE